MNFFILKNNMATLLCCFKVYTLLRSHLWIETGVTNRKRTIQVTMVDFFGPCDLKIWRMTSKKIGHLFYTTLRFAYYFVAICGFKLELQAKIIPFSAHVTLKFDGWHRKNRALLCHCKLCVLLHSHMWIQTGVTPQKRPNWGKIRFDLCDLDLWPLTLNVHMDMTFINGNNSWLLKISW